MSILIGITLNLQIVGQYGHLKNINYSNPCTQDIFPFFCVIFNFLHQCFIVVRVQVFTSLTKFISNYFILFDAVLKRIVFLLSLSDHSLLVYRNATDFSKLILYPVTFLNSFTSPNTFSVETLGFSTYSIMSYENRGSLTSSLPIQMIFISFAF